MMAERNRSLIRWAELLIRLGVGALFIWTGILKVAGNQAFFLSLLDYRTGAPEFLLRIIAACFPWLEVILGLLLLLDWWKLATRALTLVCCVAFMLMLGQAWSRGLDISCGCFGEDAGGLFTSPPIAFLRASLLAASAGFLTIRVSMKFRPSGQ